jgi:L-ascorbate metabolism protein UlaG (beta-lactamase superfamily)
MLKPAFLKDEALIEDVQRALKAGGLRLWWLGQSGFLIARGGRILLLDPYLSDSLTRKYERTDKPHVRVTERVVDPAALGALGKVDLITSSHNHTDHFDPETLKPILYVNPQARLAIPAANRELAIQGVGLKYAGRLVEIDAGRSATIAGVEISGITAAHPTVERDAGGRCRFLGYVLRVGDFTIYHSGDTMMHDGLASALQRFKIDLALLPINGDRPERRVAGNLDGRQAVHLARNIRARCVVPCHYDLFEFNTASPAEFVTECVRLGQAHRVLRNGEGMDLLSKS